MALTDYALIPVVDMAGLSGSTAHEKIVSDGVIFTDGAPNARIGYMVTKEAKAQSADETHFRFCYVESAEYENGGAIVFATDIESPSSELFATTYSSSASTFYNYPSESYSTYEGETMTLSYYVEQGTDGKPEYFVEGIPVYDTLDDALAALADEIVPPEPVKPTKRRKIVMNGGYVLIDCEGVNLTSDLPATVTGLHDILMRSIAVNKPIILYNCGSINTPIGAACSIGESNLISVITYVGSTFTVSESDVVTIIS